MLLDEYFKVVGEVLDKCTRTPPLASLADHKNEKKFLKYEY